jgi:hypothetical protein
LTPKEKSFSIVYMNNQSKGRGRTKGSFSFITLSGEQLAKFPNVVVSRKWAEAVGIGSDAVAKNSIETLKGNSIASETETAEPIAAIVEL